MLPGERLTQETLDYIADSSPMAARCAEPSDRTLKTIRVVVE